MCQDAQAGTNILQEFYRTGAEARTDIFDYIERFHIRGKVDGSKCVSGMI
jgi:hypothetical protein